MINCLVTARIFSLNYKLGLFAQCFPTLFERGFQLWPASKPPLVQKPHKRRKPKSPYSYLHKHSRKSKMVQDVRTYT